MIAAESRKAQRITPREGKVRITAGQGRIPDKMKEDLIVSNVSTTGLSFTSPYKLHAGDEYTLSMSAFHLASPVKVKGKVVWCEPQEKGFAVGVAFEGIKDPDRVRIDQLPGCIDLKRVHIDPNLSDHVPAALALRRKVVPFSRHNNTLHVAMADPDDAMALDALRRVCKLNLKVYCAEEQDVTTSARMLYATDRARTITAGEEDDLQAVAFLNDLIRAAIVQHASDIHLEPEPPAKARFRVDGRLVYGPNITKALYPALVSRIKVLAGLDIAEKREAQDGRMSWNHPGTETIDMRVATIPTVHGEHVTMRLLGGQHGPKKLEDLGMLPRELGIFDEAISIPYGLILLTGPTGCGKSTTLYASLEAIKAPDVHIVSVEDPVERKVAGISQVQVDQADKVSFDKALRSLLRHDPDVVMIGEIRDDLSLDVALKSALTGHLVFSTVHTSDATSAPARLIHMGAPHYLVAATISLVMAQRLVRKLCTECKRPGELDERAARFLDLEPGLPVRLPGGCVACNGTGYSGRMGVFELFAASERIREMIVQGASAGMIRAAALEEGMTTLRSDGAAKVKLGLTDPGEVMRAVAGTIEIKGGEV
ncbi:MAG: ATPase, T2SS/T4P/T4SS family [Planctomycetota bacterium]|jgi:type IV pilus assembly protein PilB